MDSHVKLIGVYSTHDAAPRAVDRLRLRPGFCDAPDGFTIDPFTMDEDNWQDGYITLPDGMLPSDLEGTRQPALF
jgi:hypothetical protein